MRACILRGLLIAITTLSVSSGVVFAATFEDGLAAAQRGNYAIALQLWRPLAEQGNAEAQYELGVMYFEGQGVAEDFKEAAKWYQLAAEQGNAAAQFSIGFMYAKGQGVAQDFKEAVKWYLLSAEQGYRDRNVSMTLKHLVS